MRKPRGRARAKSPRPSHSSAPNRPLPGRRPSSAGTAATLDPAAATPIQLSMNRPARRLQPPGPTGSRTDRPPTTVYGRTHQTVAFHAAEDKRGPAGLSRSLQNWEIVPETRGLQDAAAGVCGAYIRRKGLLHRQLGRGNEAERRRFGRHGDDVSLSTALSPYPAQCQLPCANVNFPGPLQSYPAQSNVL